MLRMRDSTSAARPACTSISSLPFSLLILMITPSRRGRSGNAADQAMDEAFAGPARLNP